MRLSALHPQSQKVALKMTVPTLVDTRLDSAYRADRVNALLSSTSRMSKFKEEFPAVPLDSPLGSVKEDVMDKDKPDPIELVPLDPEAAVVEEHPRLSTPRIVALAAGMMMTFFVGVSGRLGDSARSGGTGIPSCD